MLGRPGPWLPWEGTGPGRPEKAPGAPGHSASGLGCWLDLVKNALGGNLRLGNFSVHRLCFNFLQVFFFFFKGVMDTDSVTDSHLKRKEEQKDTL